MMNSIVIFAAGLTLFLAGLIFSRKVKKSAHWVLAIWLIVTCFELLVFWVDRNQFYESYPFLIGTRELFLFLHPPLLFLYILTLRRQKFAPSQLLHLLPFTFISLFLYSTFYHLEGAIKLNSYLEAASAPISVQGGILQLVVLGYVFAYLLISLKTASKASRENPEDTMRNWTVKVVGGYIIAWSSVVIFSILSYFLDLGLDTVFLKDLGLVLFTIFIICCAMIGLKQTEVFTERPEKVAYITLRRSRNPYAKSGLSESEAINLVDRLDQFMDSSKPYLDSGLSLNSLAKAMDTTTNHLSQAINTVKGMNFADFVNSHRIKEFQKLLIDEEYSHYSMLGLAMECGFNSKSAFNNAFKKHTGLTPSQYQQQQLLIN